MIDIKSLGPDVKLDKNGDKYKALNLLAVQLRNKNYAADFGIDLDFFINGDYQLQSSTLKSHILKRIFFKNCTVGFWKTFR